jgi:hypothetical protein
MDLNISPISLLANLLCAIATSGEASIRNPAGILNQTKSSQTKT